MVSVCRSVLNYLSNKIYHISPLLSIGYGKNLKNKAGGEACLVFLICHYLVSFVIKVCSWIDIHAVYLYRQVDVDA